MGDFHFENKQEQVQRLEQSPNKNGPKYLENTQPGN